MLLPESLKLHDQSAFEFHYIYFLPWKNQMVEAIEAAGGKVTCFPANNNLQLMQQMGKVKRYIREHQIDVVHAHLPWAGFLARFIHRNTGIPLIYTEHNKQERYHRATFWMNKLTFPWQSKVLAVSEDVAQSIHQFMPKSVPVQTLLNGVNTDYFVREQKAQASSPKALTVGTIAVFRFQKRLEEWLEVFHTAYQKKPELRGIIVGAGPLEESIKAKRRALDLEEVVEMPGLQTNPKEWFARMDVFMMTSVFEGLPIALLEAMSMECTILSTKAGGVGEVVEEGKSGLLVEVNDWKQLATRLEELYDPTLRDKLSKGARRRVVEKFSMQRMVEELEAVYVVHG